MPPSASVKLGRRPPRHDPRTLKLARYLSMASLIDLNAPPRVDWTAGVTAWGMMLNDRLGSCAIACPGHLIQTWTRNASGAMVTLPDSEILAAYREVGGYRDGEPDTDNGCIVLDVLKHWRKVGIGGRKIKAFAQVNAFSLPYVHAAAWLFGGLYLGLALPLSVADTTGPGHDWALPADGGDRAGSWGGHAVQLIGLDDMVPDNDPAGMQIVTWGHVKGMSRAFYAKYGNPLAGGEAWAVLSEDWDPAGDNRPAPCGFDLAALERDLARVAG